MLVDALQLFQPQQQPWLSLALTLLFQLADDFLDLSGQGLLEQFHHLLL